MSELEETARAGESGCVSETKPHADQKHTPFYLHNCECSEPKTLTPLLTVSPKASVLDTKGRRVVSVVLYSSTRLSIGVYSYPVLNVHNYTEEQDT